MNVVPYKAEHLLALQHRLQPGQAKYAPFINEQHARTLEDGLAFAGIIDGTVIGVGGVCGLHPNRGLLWSFLSADVGKHFVGVHRAVERLIELAPFRRIEAECDVDFEPGHRWLRKLGFEMEARCLRAFRIDGGDSALYAKVR